MTAYAFVDLTISNPESFEAYREQAGLALKKHGGTPLHVSKEAEIIEGEGMAPTVSVILTFPDRAAAKAWIEDPEFKHVHDLRRGAGVSNITLM